MPLPPAPHRGAAFAAFGPAAPRRPLSMAALREYFDHRFDALDQRFDTLESLLRSMQNFQISSLISIIATMLAGFAGLLFAVLSRT